MIESNERTPGARRMTINDHIEIETEGTLSPYQSTAVHISNSEELNGLRTVCADDPLVIVRGLRDRIKTVKQRIAQRREEIAHLQTEAKMDDASLGALVGELHAALDRLVKEAAL